MPSRTRSIGIPHSSMPAACAKIVGSPVDALLELTGAGTARTHLRRCIHVALDVIVDASPHCPGSLLGPDGVIIFDDYDWTSPIGEDPLLLPCTAIDAFLGLVRDHC